MNRKLVSNIFLAGLILSCSSVRSANNASRAKTTPVKNILYATTVAGLSIGLGILGTKGFDYWQKNRQCKACAESIENIEFAVGANRLKSTEEADKYIEHLDECVPCVNAETRKKIFKLKDDINTVKLLHNIDEQRQKIRQFDLSDFEKINAASIYIKSLPMVVKNNPEMSIELQQLQARMDRSLIGINDEQERKHLDAIKKMYSRQMKYVNDISKLKNSIIEDHGGDRIDPFSYFKKGAEQEIVRLSPENANNVSEVLQNERLGLRNEMVILVRQMNTAFLPDFKREREDLLDHSIRKNEAAASRIYKDNQQAAYNLTKQASDAVNAINARCREAIAVMEKTSQQTCSATEEKMKTAALTIDAKMSSVVALESHVRGLLHEQKDTNSRLSALENNVAKLPKQSSLDKMQESIEALKKTALDIFNRQEKERADRTFHEMRLHEQQQQNGWNQDPVASAPLMGT